MIDIVVLPGIGGSGEGHWQTLWGQVHPRMRRFRPGSWDAPVLEDWMLALYRAVQAASDPPLLLAHSLACLLVAHWQHSSSASVSGAFLVAVPDPASAVFPPEAAEFANPPQSRFRFPSLVVASCNDPYGTVQYARTQAAHWQSDLVEVGALGHINAASGLADWPQGRDLFGAFASRVAQRPDSS